MKNTFKAMTALLLSVGVVQASSGSDLTGLSLTSSATVTLASKAPSKNEVNHHAAILGWKKQGGPKQYEDFGAALQGVQSVLDLLVKGDKEGAKKAAGDKTIAAFFRKGPVEKLYSPLSLNLIASSEKPLNISVFYLEAYLSLASDKQAAMLTEYRTSFAAVVGSYNNSNDGIGNLEADFKKVEAWNREQAQIADLKRAEALKASQAAAAASSSASASSASVFSASSSSAKLDEKDQKREKDSDKKDGK